MPVLKQVPLSSALDLYQKSGLAVRVLGSKLPESDLEDIVQEVLNRVKAQALRNHKSVDTPTREKVERLCYALISDDDQEGQRFIESVYEDGASLEAIYLSYLAGAAIILGEWWESDDASFYEVSIGTSRIYAIMRGLSYLFVPTKLVEVKSAVFASIPGETHDLGIRMAADLFGKEGWDVDMIIGKNHDDLVADIAQSRCPVIGLSAAGSHSVAALARLVIALRISNPWAAIVLSGQITNEAEDVVSALDLDGVVKDIPSALTLFDRIWDSANSR
jgi:MerR family transcriptional regulator, light-induced transcriptional regulator